MLRNLGFMLTKEELSEVVTNCDHLRSLKFSPVPHYVFTEEGVAQLSSVLRSDKAVEVSIMIMDAFVAMRRFLSANAGMFQRIERLEQHQILTDQKVEQVLQRMDELAPTVTPEQIFATGCVWDAWSYVSQLVRSAKQRIVLIDNFVDERVLTLLTKREKGVSATIHSRYTEQFKLDLEKHNEQCEPVVFVQLPHKSHDRFLIVANSQCLHRYTSYRPNILQVSYNLASSSRVSASSLYLHAQFPSPTPGVFIRAQESKHNTSCIGTIAMLATEPKHARIIIQQMS